MGWVDSMGGYVLGRIVLLVVFLCGRVRPVIMFLNYYYVGAVCPA